MYVCIRWSHVVPKLVTWRKQDRLSFGAEISLSLFDFFTAFSIGFRLGKMARASSMGCLSYATVRYSTEQALSMVMDDQLPNKLAADSDSGSVWDVLCWRYHEWIVNKLWKSTNNVHSIKSKSNLICAHLLFFKLMYGWIWLDDWLRRYSSFNLGM